MAPRWGGLRPEPYDPDARDADGDGIVQEGTAWERPGGTRLIDRAGRAIERGASSTTRPAGLRVVDRDGKPVDYTPTYGDGPSAIDSGTGAPTALSDHGARPLRDLVPDIRTVTRPQPDPEPEEDEIEDFDLADWGREMLREAPAPVVEEPKVNEESLQQLREAVTEHQEEIRSLRKVRPYVQAPDRSDPKEVDRMIKKIMVEGQRHEPKAGSPDSRMDLMIVEQGYDALPETVPSVEDLPEGQPVYYRGVATDEQVDDFVSGGYFVGVGNFGNGVYASDREETASDRVGADDLDNRNRGSVITFALRPEAKVISFEDAVALAEALDAADPGDGSWNFPEDPIRQFTHSPTQVAALFGYDAVAVKRREEQGFDVIEEGETYLILLNRSAVVAVDPRAAERSDSPAPVDERQDSPSPPSTPSPASPTKPNDSVSTPSKALVVADHPIRPASADEFDAPEDDGEADRLQAFMDRSDIGWGEVRRIVAVDLGSREETEKSLPEYPTTLTGDDTEDAKTAMRFASMAAARRLTEQGVDLADYHTKEYRRKNPNSSIEMWTDPDEDPKGRLVLISVGSTLRVVKWPPTRGQTIISPRSDNYQELVNQAAVKGLIDDWARGSFSGNAATAQESLEELFQLGARKPNASSVVNDDVKDEVRTVAEALYGATQEYLADGPDEHVLHRGMNISDPLSDSIAAASARRAIFADIEDTLADVEVPTSSGLSVPLHDYVQRPNNMLARLIEAEPPPPDWNKDTSPLDRVLQEIYKRRLLSEERRSAHAEWIREWFAEAKLSITDDEVAEAEAIINAIIGLRDGYDGGDATGPFTSREIDVPDLQVELNPMSAFSRSPSIAKRFMGSGGMGRGVSLQGVYRVPRERIVGTPGTGFGTFPEKEVVVAGGGSVQGRHKMTFGVEPWIALTLERLLARSDSLGV